MNFSDFQKTVVETSILNDEQQCEITGGNVIADDLIDI